MDENKQRRRPNGRRRLSWERARYFELMEQGLSNGQICAELHINRRTGQDWRRGISETKYGRFYEDGSRAGSSSFPSPPAKYISPRFFSESERIDIADRLRAKQGIREIARALDRAPSSISREIKRNQHPTNAQYHPHAAQRRAELRRPRPKQGKIAAHPLLHHIIQGQLNQRWSPEQISKRLRVLYPERPEMSASPETIYQALYLQGRGELRREISKYLRTGRAMRIHHKRADARRSRFDEPMILISERPAEIEDRAVPGHWEGDLIIGKDHASAIATLVERSTRFVMLVPLPRKWDAFIVADLLVEKMTTLPAVMRRSLTWDQGTEMARHKKFSMATEMPVYFCDPGSPWQRGSNENTNGLLRQYFPKGTDLLSHSPKYLDFVAQELNERPRKTLDWMTPAERLTMILDQENH